MKPRRMESGASGRIACEAAPRFQQPLFQVREPILAGRPSGGPPFKLVDHAAPIGG